MGKKRARSIAGSLKDDSININLASEDSAGLRFLRSLFEKGLRYPKKEIFH